MKKLLIGISILTMLVGCHKDDPEEVKPERTVLIYMAAENNLTNWSGEEFADPDIDEIKEGAKLIGNNHLVVYVDKAEDAKPYFLHFTNGDLKDSVPTTYDTQTSDPAVLEEVARNAFKDYPANSYGLVLWGHASGWMMMNDSVSYTSMARKKAYGGDTGNNTTSSAGRTWMNIPSMAKALSHVPHLDFIFADCCNFMCLESAYELRNVTDYLIGSPAEIPGVGAPYNTIVPALFDKTTFYSSIIDKYYAQRDRGYDVPLSAIKSSEMANLASATKTVLKALKPNIEGDYPDMNGIIHYYYTLKFHDANDFILNYASANDYSAWKQALDKAVVYKKMATKWQTNMSWNGYYYDFSVTDEKFGGVSMFVPQYPYSGYSQYNEDIEKMGWYYAAGYNDIGW